MRHAKTQESHAHPKEQKQPVEIYVRKPTIGITRQKEIFIDVQLIGKILLDSGVQHGDSNFL